MVTSYEKGKKILPQRVKRGSPGHDATGNEFLDNLILTKTRWFLCTFSNYCSRHPRGIIDGKVN